MFFQNMQKTLTSPDAQEKTQKQAAASRSFEGIGDVKNLKAKKIIIMTGDEDHIMPEENAHKMLKLFPQAHLIIYKQVGHLILIENPNEFLDDIVNFLNQKDFSCE